MLHNLRSSAIAFADGCLSGAALIGIGAGIWLGERGILKKGGNIGDGIVHMIIGAVVSFPITLPLALLSLLTNVVFWTYPIRKERAEAAKQPRHDVLTPMPRL